MLFERIESKGLAHYSYLVGDGLDALVIDPRRDCEVYVERAAQEGLRIAHVLETHRHEDYVVGSVELAARTGAQIWRADAQMEYRYGQPVEDGQVWQVGRLKVQAIGSPGHPPGSMSYLLHDPNGAPWIVFTGDALFAGSIGRVDFFGMERAQELASLLYDTLFHKLLPLGDGIIVCPAHGSGSLCGSSIAERTWTTVGLERRLNPKLQFADREAFVAHAVEELEQPPYFRRMERRNLEGTPRLGALPVPRPLAPGEFAARMQDAVVLDTRAVLGVAHVPGAYSIWLDGLAGFAGWFLPDERPILLVSEPADLAQAVRCLVRMGYDDLAGYLAGGMQAWHTAGRESAAIRTLTVHELRRRLDAHESLWLLDVRSKGEVEADPTAGAVNIPLTQLPQRLDEVPQDRPITVFCGSGMRATVAASLLQRAGRQDVTVVLGGRAAWHATAQHAAS